MIENYFQNNEYFRYLKNYYSLDDTASIYGVSRMEIKHSNFLSYILNPDKGTLGTMNIRNLLRIIQKKCINNYKFKKLKLDNVSISNTYIARENHNIDLLITLKINNEDYAIVIENKIESIIHDDQLVRYKNAIKNNYDITEDNTILVFLYSNYQDKKIIKEQESIAKADGYTPITYQNIYEDILLPSLDFSTDIKEMFMITEYIHCLAKNNYDSGDGIMIITRQDRNCLSNLFKEQYMIDLVNNINPTKASNEYTEFYQNNKVLLLMIFNKYRRILMSKDKSNKLISKLDSIMENKKYILHTDVSKPYKGIADLLSNMIAYLNSKFTYDELDEKLNHLYSDPLFVPVKNVFNVDHPKWFTTYNKTILIGNKECYILSAWNSSDYEDLRNKINELNIGVTLE